MDETNLLSLIRPWLNNIYQITTKKHYSTILPKILSLNRPRFFFALWGSEVWTRRSYKSGKSELLQTVDPRPVRRPCPGCSRRQLGHAGGTGPPRSRPRRPPPTHSGPVQVRRAEVQIPRGTASCCDLRDIPTSPFRHSAHISHPLPSSESGRIVRLLTSKGAYGWRRRRMGYGHSYMLGYRYSRCLFS
jgi:hypothetical protein